MQFSIKVLLLLTLSVALGVCATNPGGVYFTAPVGCLTCGFLYGLLELWRHCKSAQSKQFLHSAKALRGCGLVAVSVSLFLLYAPFMTLARRYQDSAIREQITRDSIEKNAQNILDEGRALIACTRTNERIAGDSPIVPPAIRLLGPEYLDNYGGKLLVYMKPGIDPICLSVFPQGKPGIGGRRLIPGLWLHDRSTPKLILDSAWDAGVRQ